LMVFRKDITFVIFYTGSTLYTRDLWQESVVVFIWVQ